MAFHGKGVDMLPAAATAGGKIDALKMSETVQPTTEQEVGRAIDIKSGRVSKVFTGTRDLIEPPFPDKSGRLFIHTHVPDLGPRPGLIDARATTDMGIIRSGNYRSFFIGQAETKAGSEQLQALVLDDANKQAFLLNHVRDNSNAAIWQGSVPSYVDYNAARTTLQSLDVKGAWSQFMKLPKFEGRPLLPEHYNIATGKPLSAGKM
jgi:hypothetical protein